MALAFFEVWQGTAPARWTACGMRGENPVYIGRMDTDHEFLNELVVCGVVFSVVLSVPQKRDLDKAYETLRGMGVETFVRRW